MARNEKSITIMHHMRWLAAFLVAFSHIRQNLLLDYAMLRHHSLLDKLIFTFAGYGRAGVIVFFVLSGFLVGGKAFALYQAPDAAAEWPHFLADRFSRIYTVLVPALAFSALVLLYLHHVAADAPFMVTAPWGWAIDRPIGADLSLPRFLGNIALLNGLNIKTLMVDGPLWSLAFEWFYYMAALALVLLLRRIFSIGGLAIIAYAAALAVAAAFFNPEFLLLGLAWVMGAVAKLVFDRELLRGRALQILGVILVVGLLGLLRVKNVNDLVLAAAMAFLVAHHNWSSWRGGEAWGKSLANFSYSFYLVHFPLSCLVLGILYQREHIQQRLPLDAKGLAIAGGTLIAAIIFARIFAFFTEDRTPRVRRLLWHPKHRPAASTPVAKAAQEA